MNFSEMVWEQIKNKSIEGLNSALLKDDWVVDRSEGSALLYMPPNGRRVSLHFHPHRTFNAILPKLILDQIGWYVKDIRRLKLIK